MIGLGVTGTDTGVGKTVVSCALAAAYAQRGARVGVLKPVETGVVATATDRDGVRLAAAAGNGDDAPSVTPYTFAEPLAPFIAARRTKSTIDMGRLDGAFRKVSRNRDVVIVEGAGGLLVPLSAAESFDTLFARWRLAVIVVAANRLGVINHVRLTLRAAAGAGLAVRAVVLNEVGARPGDASASSNESALRDLLPEIRVVRFPWIPQTSDHPSLAEAAERSGLLAAIDGASSSAPLPVDP